MDKLLVSSKRPFGSPVIQTGDTDVLDWLKAFPKQALIQDCIVIL
jgi:hypothetical protein